MSKKKRSKIKYAHYSLGIKRDKSIMYDKTFI